MPAKSMYSYSDTLYAVLDEFKPSSCFEWGPGTSTQIMALHPAVVTLNSVEHEVIFYDIVERLKLPNVLLHLASNLDDYVNVIGDAEYDFIFVDGRDRVRCLERAIHVAPLVMLHDAARAEYRDAVLAFKYQVWTDGGNTVCLTNDEEIYGRLSNLFKDRVCEPPSEKVYFLEGAKGHA